MIAMVNHDVLPVIPCQGSVGASGDLAPQAHPSSANITETPATFGISVGRWEVKTDDRRERLDDIE